jgi:hypothetical protein
MQAIETLDQTPLKGRKLYVRLDELKTTRAGKLLLYLPFTSLSIRP